MKFYGSADLQKNYLRDAVIPLDYSFPVSTVPGHVVFKDRTLYICVEITNDGTPIWVPLTKEITAYTHIQSSPSASWSIDHPLNSAHVSITVYDSQNRVVIPNEVTIDGISSATVSFSAAATGKAVVLTGHFDGQTAPVFAYEHYQTNPSTSWVIAHGLGRYPAIRVFVGNQEVQPASITFDSVDQVTLVFNSAYVGQAKLI